MNEFIVKNERTKNKKESAITAGVEPNQTLKSIYEASIVDFARHIAISEKFYPERILFPNIDYRN
jgi:hypothetical protein